MINNFIAKQKMVSSFSVCLILVLFIPRAFGSNQINITTVESSSTYRLNNASFAIDGDFSQVIRRCAHTDVKRDIQEAWLRLDLGEIYSVKTVKFWYRNDRGSNYQNTIRLRGYSIRVSNDTALPPPESSCYSDPGNVTLPTIIEKDCERTASYVWFYQDKGNGHEVPMLEICEVQVVGCETGRYGENCSNTCDHCKNKDHCNITSGSCDIHGCANQNMIPPLCSHCLSGLYGTNCSRHCSQLCKEKRCDISLGTCLSGCEIGYTGTFCNITCPYGRYGDSCQGICNNCLESSTCHHVSGVCASGCNEGYKACTMGEYGRNCENQCGHCHNHEACNRFDGRCRDCETGYQGLRCDNECRSGTYGRNCSETCGACLDGTTCHHIYGHCSLGCRPGWKSTPTCDDPCPPGTFGPNCINKCSGNCLHQATCDKETGKCKACSEGWRNDFCNEKSKELTTDLDKMTLEHLMLDNARISLEMELLKKESQKITIESSFLKIKDEYLRLKMQSEFQIFTSGDPKISISEKKPGQNVNVDNPESSTPSLK
uniref:Protein draper-like isoform X2 n=1 Tax=Crassostrea virginica TaxID=6565 RepID=A0A8B8C6J0_CRAVI|nr:protein draper-like isoform X2 [Crassostrea virginica]